MVFFTLAICIYVYLSVYQNLQETRNCIFFYRRGSHLNLIQGTYFTHEESPEHCLPEKLSTVGVAIVSSQHIMSLELKTTQ